MKLPQFAIDYLLKVHKRARKYPYYHIPSNDGTGMFMDRMWILGARSPERNNDNPRWKRKGFVQPESSWLYRQLCRLVCIRAHTTFRSDSDRHLHDHPSWNISIVLQGGYFEILETDFLDSFDGSFDDLYSYYLELVGEIGDRFANRIARDLGFCWRGPGSVVFRRAKTPHRLILPPNTVCKSIFIQGPKTNDWGFIVDGVKVGWKKYLGVE